MFLVVNKGVAGNLEASLDSIVWEQVNQDGFGMTTTGQIPSLAVFGDHLYAGAQNNTGGIETAQIWRTANGMDWTQVDYHDVNGTAALIVFGNQIYAGSWSGTIWRSDDGLSWTDVITDAFGNPDNGGIARFAVYGGLLYASTWNGITGSQVWRTDNGTDWDQFLMDFGGNPFNVGAIASEVFQGELYWGVMNFDSGAQLWKTDGVSLTEVMTGGFGTADNTFISALGYFNGDLYAGVSNIAGVQVWRSDNGEDWERVVDDLGNPNTANAQALQVFHNQLYLFAQNDVTGMEVWRTANGVSWEQVGYGGFGDANNIMTYFDNGTTVFDNQMYVGTNNFWSGAEIWRLTVPYSRTMFLPLINR